MKSVLKKLQFVENLIIVVSFALMVICVFGSVVNRNFIKLSIPWFDELATFCMVYMALLGTEAGLRDGSQIAVTAVVNKFRGKGKRYIQILSKLIVTVFSAVVLYYSIHMVNVQAATGQVTPALHIPMAVPYMALCISFFIITCVQGVAIVYMIMHLNDAAQEGGE